MGHRRLPNGSDGSRRRNGALEKNRSANASEPSRWLLYMPPGGQCQAGGGGRGHRSDRGARPLRRRADRLGGGRLGRVSPPFFHAERIRTPTLFMGGDRDFIVPLIGGEIAAPRTRGPRGSGRGPALRRRTRLPAVAAGLQAAGRPGPHPGGGRQRGRARGLRLRPGYSRRLRCGRGFLPDLDGQEHQGELVLEPDDRFRDRDDEQQRVLFLDLYRHPGDRDLHQDRFFSTARGPQGATCPGPARPTSSSPARSSSSASSSAYRLASRRFGASAGRASRCANIHWTRAGSVYAHSNESCSTPAYSV